MPYPKAATTRFTLEDFHPDAADLWVEIRDTEDLPASTTQMYYRAQMLFARMRANNEPMSKDDEWALTAAGQISRQAIIAWNLPYERDESKVIPLDGTEPDPMGQLPQKVYAYVVGKVMERLRGESKSG